MEKLPKKLCTEDSKDSLSSEANKQEGSFNNLKNVKLEKILNQVEQQKTVFILGQVAGSSNECVLILEKKPFSVENVEEILSEETSLKQVFHNDIYSLYEGFTSPKLNPLKVTMIYPATEKHIQKYTAQEKRLVTETSELYNSVVLPHIKEQQFSIQWLCNILDHKAESERILFEDPDPENGFILLPDLKWDGKSIEQLYITAICHRRDLKSIRDLTSKHISLLQNIKSKSMPVLKEKFNILPDQFRMYLHYQPSYYHLHIHICALKYEPPGIQCEKGHLLDTVLYNLNIMSDYYSKATLTYVLSESDPLYRKIKEKALVSE